MHIYKFHLHYYKPKPTDTNTRLQRYKYRLPIMKQSSTQYIKRPQIYKYPHNHKYINSPKYKIETRGRRRKVPATTKGQYSQT